MLSNYCGLCWIHGYFLVVQNNVHYLFMCAEILENELKMILYELSLIVRVIMSLVVQVRPYPRRAFSDGESALTLNELGLTSKQEALFLELI